MQYGNVSKTVRYLIDRHLKQYDYSKLITEECPNFPYLIHLEPTNICNLKCIHCIQKDMTRKRGMMSFDTFKKVVDEISQYHCALTLDMQGEPLLHKQILEFVEYSKKKGLFTSIITNGCYLTEEISQSLIKSGLDRIMFSFDSLEKEIYEKIRIGASFERTFSNILKFLNLNIEVNSPTYVCVAIVIEEENKNKIDQYIDFFYQLPVNEVFAFPVLNMLGSVEKGNNEALDNFQLKPKEQWPICRVPWDHLSINWNGDVVGCPVDFDGRFVLANVNDKSLEEIWNSSRMRILRKSLIEKDYTDIEKEGNYCGHCTCMWNEEYDLRDYKKFMNSFFIRELSQLGPKIGKIAYSSKEIANKQSFLSLVESRLSDNKSVLGE